MLVGASPHLFLVLQRTVVLLFVGGEAILAQDEFGQVERETVGVFQREDIRARNLLAFGFLHQFVQQGDTLLQRAEECLFLALDDGDDLLLLRLEFGVGIAHVVYQLRHQLI